MSNDEILKKLEDHEKRIVYLESVISDEKKVEQIVKRELKYEKMIAELKLNEEILSEIYDYENQKLTLLLLVGNSEKELTQNIAMLIILGYSYLLDVHQVHSKEIKRSISEHGLSINHFAAKLNEIIPKYIRRIGKAKSPSVKYKLTIPGEKKAKELLLKIVGD